MELDYVAKLLALAMTAAFAANASAVDEVEPNDSAGTSQVISSNGSPIVINAVMGHPDNPGQPDLDFYQFSARAGDVLTINIDNGYKPDAPLDTIIALFGEAPDYLQLRTNEYAETFDSGSISPLDARIDDFVVPADGVYTVGVSASPLYFYDGGLTATVPARFLSKVVTDYKLTISGASATGTKINIEVKPGSRGLAPLNPQSKGKIPVAILGSLNFSAITVDTATLTFGSTGDEQSLSKCAGSIADLNGDGHYDLLCHFENQEAGFKPGDLEGILKGKTKSGKSFEGRGLLKVLPTKTRKE
jgi:hypothetical protein